MSELMSQVLYLDPSTRKEAVTIPEPQSEARDRANNMTADGIEVLAILDADKSEEYLNRPKGDEPEVEAAKQHHKMVLHEMAESFFEEPPLEKRDRVRALSKLTEAEAKERHRDESLRRTALDATLRLYAAAATTGFVGTPQELVKDAKVVLEFLKG